MTHDRPKSNQKSLAAIMPWYVFIAAAVSLHLVICDGTGLVNDSLAYVQGAKHLHEGLGLTTFDGDGKLEPLTQFGPLTSITLAIGLNFGLSLEHASLVLVSTSQLATLLLLYLLNRRCVPDLRRCTSATDWLAVGGIIALSINRAGIEVFAFVLSEPLFLFGVSLALAAFTKYLDLARAIDRPGSRMIAATLTGLGIATALASRYAGVALLASISAVWFLQQLRVSRGGRSQYAGCTTRINGPFRLADAAIIFTPAIATGLAMFAHNRAAGEVSAGRSIGFHPPGLESLEQFLEAAVRWTIGEASTLPLLVGLVFAIIANSMLSHVRKLSMTQDPSEPISPATGSPAHHIRLVIATFMLTYVAFIIIAHTSFDGYIPFDLRILAPAFMCVPTLTCACLSLVNSPGGLRLRRWAIVFLAFCIGSQFISTARWVIRAPTDRLGYASQIWRESETMRFIRSLPEDDLIYSHQPNAIYLCTGRFARPVPTVFNMLSKRPAEGYVNQLRAMRDALRAHPGVIVYFDRSRSRSRVPVEKLATDLPMRVLHQFEDGTVYIIDTKD